MKRNTVSRIRHLITFQEPVTTPDNAGGGTRTWQDFANVWAEMMLVGKSGNAGLRGAGHKVFSGKQLEARLSHRIYMRYRGDITSDMRIVFEGRIFKIHYIGVIDENKAEMEILAEEGSAS